MLLAKIDFFSEIHSLAILHGSRPEQGKFTERSGGNSADICPEPKLLGNSDIPSKTCGRFRGAKIGHMGVIAPPQGQF